MAGKLPNRIAQEDLPPVDSWALPSVDQGKVVNASRGGAYGRPTPGRQASGGRASSQEIIEEVNPEDIPDSPMTAEELQSITESAEKEGFNKGYGEGYEQGERKGRDEGYARGMELAQTEARESLEQHVAQLLHIAEALVNPIAEQEQQLENLVLDYVTQLTTQLVQRELQTDSSQITQFVTKAMQALPVGAKQVRISLNPQDIELIQAHIGASQPDWTFIADPELMPGGCRIQSAESLVDYSVEKRLAELFEQFRNRQLADGEPSARIEEPSAKQEQPSSNENDKSNQPPSTPDDGAPD